MPASVTDALRYWARTTPDAPAFVLGEDTVSYAEAEAWSGRVAHLLKEAGLAPGDRLSVIGENTLSWCITLLAAMRAGAVVAPFNNRLMVPELEKIARDCTPSVIVADPSATDRIEELAKAVDGIEIVPMQAVADQRSATGPSFDHDDLDLDGAALIIYTSGTTGKQKGAIFTQRTILGVPFEWSLVEPETFRHGLRLLLVLPLAFSPGTVWGICLTTILGGVLVVEPGLNGPSALAALERHRIQALFGPPIVFETISSAPGFDAADLSSLSTTHTGGARVPAELLRRWMGKGVALRQIYGLTEAGGSITATSKDDAAEHTDSCGTGNIFTQFRIVRDDGTRCDAGEPGEIVVRGPSVTPGYWSDPETTAIALRDGWLHTGDLGVVDGDGRLTFVDRLKDLIISGGINVSPLEIEGVIAAAPGVAEVAVIPVADARFGETPAALVHGEGLTPQAIVEHCNGSLADYKVPRYVVVVDEPLPRLPGGKIAKAALKSEYADIPERFEKVR